MPLQTFTDQEMLEYVRALIREEATDPDLSRYADWDIEARILAKLFIGNQSQALSIQKQFSPRTCDDANLDLNASARGLTRYRAATYKGRAVFEGTAGTNIPLGTAFVTADGRRFLSTAAATVSQAAWSGKTVGDLAGRARVTVSPDTSGISIGDVLSIGTGSNDLYVVKSIITGTPIVEIFRRHARDLVAADAFDPIAGAVIQIEAEEAGNDHQLHPWDTLSLETPITNVDDDGVVCEMAGGGDDESNEELRARLIAFDEARPGSGNYGSYLQWVLETPTIRVGKCFVYPNAVAPGAVSLVALGVSGSRKLSDENLATIRTYLTEQGPFTDVIDVRTGDYAIDVDVDVILEVGSGYEADWGPTLDTPTIPISFTIDAAATTTVIPLTTTPVGTIEIGDRVLIPTEIGGRWVLSQRTVSALTAANITLSEALEIAPTVGELVYPGGPVAQPAIDAITTVFDELGSGVGAQNLVRFPPPTASSPSKVLRAGISSALFALDGVRNDTVVAPATDQEPGPMSILSLGKVKIVMATP